MWIVFDWIWEIVLAIALWFVLDFGHLSIHAESFWQKSFKTCFKIRCTLNSDISTTLAVTQLAFLPSLSILFWLLRHLPCCIFDGLCANSVKIYNTEWTSFDGTFILDLIYSIFLTRFPTCGQPLALSKWQYVSKLCRAEGSCLHRLNGIK